MIRVGSDYQAPLPEYNPGMSRFEMFISFLAIVSALKNVTMAFVLLTTVGLFLEVPKK